MLHSHPNDRTEDNDNFSRGDGLVSAISGRIYLSTPGGELYAPDWDDSRKVIISGLDYEKTHYANYGSKVGNILWNILSPREALLYNLRDYHAVKERNENTVSGGRFQTFDANTYHAQS